MATKTKTKKISTPNNVNLLNRLSRMTEKMDMLANDVMDGQVSAEEIYDRLDGIRINIQLIHDALMKNTND